jgi:hypothetical protein
MADMATSPRSRTAGTTSSRPGSPSTRPGDVHELLGGDQGVHRAARRHDLHLVQRADRAGPGRSSRPAGSRAPARCSSCPTSTWAATPMSATSGSLDDCVVYDPHRPMGGLTPSSARRPDDPVARALLGARAVHGRGRRGRPPRDPRVKVIVHPECRIRGRASSPTRSARPSRSSRPSRRRRPARRGWSAPSSTSSSAWRTCSPSSDRLPGEERLLLLDDEPHRPAAPGVDAGVARRGAGRQPDPGRPRGRPLGAGRPRPDARPARPGHRRPVSPRRGCRCPGRGRATGRPARRRATRPARGRRPGGSRPRDGAPTASGCARPCA